MVRWEPRETSADEGVSPVVGMILVLAISIVGIAAILYWGLPAIDEMKANVEHKSVESQFQELDASIKELVAGTTEKTAKRWQPTLNRGSISLVNETEGWVYANEMYHATNDYGFTYDGFSDNDNVVTLTNVGDVDLATSQVTAYRINGTTTGQNLRVYVGATEWTSVATLGWVQDAAKTITLKDESNVAISIGNATIRFRIYEDGDLIATAWYVPTGRVDYTLEAGLGTKTITQNNGAVISGNGQTSVILSPPPIPPVSETSGIPRFFARAVLLNATGSFTGSDRFDVLVTLYSTSTLGTFDCADDDAYTDCVASTKIFMFGENTATWENYLLNSNRGYGFESTGMPSGSSIDNYLVDARGEPMGYTLLQSTVQLTGQG